MAFVFSSLPSQAHQVELLDPISVLLWRNFVQLLLFQLLSEIAFQLEYLEHGNGASLLAGRAWARVRNELWHEMRSGVTCDVAFKVQFMLEAVFERSSKLLHQRIGRGF